ncbi:hypothetical protein JVT61DRAFT_14349 [Boletus reticuloceps]|uniref:Uncharacterized protein n=1 Tax=Boletus reticuloceps TaxID=495285 RepID=A0A8I3A2C5_9AGAM|nr:hypothetical protein JVT61DRAFT_14349 [Boletus reticuloceps]
MDGTVVELMKAIEDHLADKPSRAGEPRFSALFGTTRKRTAAIANVLSVEPIATASSLAQPSTSTNFPRFGLGVFADSS